MPTFVGMTALWDRWVNSKAVSVAPGADDWGPSGVYFPVMAGLGPATHVFADRSKERRVGVDGPTASSARCWVVNANIGAARDGA